MPLQIKRGTNTQRLAYTPSEGELVFVTDYDTAGVGPLWIGTGDVGTPYAEVSGSGGGGITELLSDLTPQLGGALDLNGFEINGIGDVDITGTVTATGVISSPTFLGIFQGNVVSEDSTLLVDAGNGYIRANTLAPGGNRLNVINNGTTSENILTIDSLDNRASIILKRDSVSDLTGDTTAQYGAVQFTRDDANGVLTTGLIFGREDSIYIGQDSGGDFSTAAKYVVWKNQKLGIGKTTPVVELDVVGDAAVSGSLTAGAILLSGSIIDTDDSSPITVTPAATFSSDVTVENDLVVRNTLTVDTLEVTNFQTAGAGTPELSSETDILLTAGTRVEVTQSPFKVASFTTAERDALTPQNGDIIYNTTDNKFQGYENGAWANLI